MSELISGKDALIAIGTDESIQFRRNMDWNDFDLDNTFGLKISDFRDPNIQFRLKPKTITINGVEVPACGKNYKPHTYMFVLNSLEPEEYSKVILDESDTVPLYWWRTEEEIKQVIEALRNIFK